MDLRVVWYRVAYDGRGAEDLVTALTIAWSLARGWILEVCWNLGRGDGLYGHVAVQLSLVARVES